MCAEKNEEDVTVSPLQTLLELKGTVEVGDSALKIKDERGGATNGIGAEETGLSDLGLFVLNEKRA